MQRVNLTEDMVIVDIDKNTRQFIKINEESEEYQAIKTETNNFTENMDFPEPPISLEDTVADLIQVLADKGVIF